MQLRGTVAYDVRVVRGFLVVVGAVLFGASGLADARTLQGKVVDAERHEPLPGAVVVIVSYRYPFLAAKDATPIFAKAVEALTDAEGDFSIEASAPWSLGAREQRLAVFKPGYRPYARHRTRRGPGELLPDDEVLTLTKVRSAREMASVTTDATDIQIAAPFERSSSAVPPGEVPKLIRLVALQRKLFAAIRRGSTPVR